MTRNQERIENILKFKIKFSKSSSFDAVCGENQVCRQDCHIGLLRTPTMEGSLPVISVHAFKEMFINI